MLNFVVAYIDNDNHYTITYTCADSQIIALKKTIPQFSNLCANNGITDDYELGIQYIDQIGIKTCAIMQVPELTNNMKMQIIAVYNPLDTTITLVQYNANSKSEALYYYIQYLLGYEDDYVANAYADRNIQAMILRTATLTGLRIYTVSTLRQLVKTSVQNK